MVMEAGGALVALNVTTLYGLPVVIVPGLEAGEMRVLGCVREELDDGQATGVCEAGYGCGSDGLGGVRVDAAGVVCG